MSTFTIRDFQIKKYLRENGLKQLGEINGHLKKMGLAYKDNSGLTKKLGTLIKNKEIEKFDQKPYPVYSVVEDAVLDFAIAGEQFCEREMDVTSGPSGVDEDYWRNDVDLRAKDSYETKFIKILVTRYGFYVFASLLKNLDYWIKKTDGSKQQSNSRKIWLNHALDLPKNQEMIFNWFLNDLTKGRVEDSNIPENKKFIKKRINKVKKIIRELYPKLSQLIDDYEYWYEKEPDTIKRLKNSPDYKEKLEHFKF